MNQTPRRRRERGAAAVEFALVVPLMISLMLGIIEFGYYFNFNTTVSNYAMVTARGYAIKADSVPADEGERKALAASALGIPASSITSAPAPSVDCTAAGNSGKAFRITIKVQRPTLTGFPQQKFTYSAKGLGQCA